MRTRITVALLALSLTVSAQTLSHSADNQTILLGNSIACATNGMPPPQLTGDNSYFRAYDLLSLGVTNPVTITSVSFGVELAMHQGGLGMQPIEIRIYTEFAPTGFPGSTAGLTLQTTESFMLPDSASGTVWRQLLSTPVAVLPFEVAVVEVFSPDGIAGNHTFFIGSNNLGENDPSYLQSTACNVLVPTPFSAVAMTTTHIILDLHYTDGTPTVELSQPGGAGTGLTITNDRMIPGNLYYNIFSLTPCGTGVGTGPFLGLCAPTLNDLLLPFSVPVNTTPLAFNASSDRQEWNIPGVFSGLTLDMLCLDLTGGVLLGASPVVRLTAL